MEPIIRKREEKDLKELAHNIAVIWNDTYKGIVDQDFLDGLYEHESVSCERMKAHLETQPDFYILELNNKIIGWTYFENQSEHESDAGEIHSLYVLKVKTMKIAMLGHKRIPSREGGVEIVVEELSTRMVKKGHEVTCYNRGGKHALWIRIKNKKLKRI